VWRRESAPGDQLGHFATLPGPWAAARPDGDHALHALGGVHLAEERLGAGLREPHRASVPELGHVWGWHLGASDRLSSGGWPDPTGWGWPPAILNVSVPLGLMVAWAGCHWLAAVPSISSLRLAWPSAAPPGSGRPVVRREATASLGGVSCLEVEVDGIDGLASDDLCVCRFQREKGPTQVVLSASHLAGR
jgi:hypothetical protein